MTVLPRLSAVAVFRLFRSRSCAPALALLLALFCFCVPAFAQTTTISGTVFDPRTTSALPLPNVLVYVTTDHVAPLPAGVQCLRYTAPSGAASYAYTAVDGTFTLKKVPVNTSYTLVIQAGKWRRQFSAPVGTSPVNGLSLHMPANHLQGDIPLIAISTGSADGVECVLRDMGIADTEFTDDTGTTNPGGRIHLYQGTGSGGAYISPSTPLDSVLTGTSTILNSYDMVMFPCQGGPYVQTDTALNNMLNFANAGGRVFGTHFSYVWLDQDYPYNSQFPPVANWHPEFTYPAPDPGVGTINTGFTEGAILAQWLQNAGATYQGLPDQVQISTLRHDIDSIIPPTQSWLTLNDATDSNPVMQFTFNTPVGAPAASQCGRVLFNEYHVMNLTTQGLKYPIECPTGPMNAQEQMLEFALFDLSDFVQPIVVPTLSIAFNPSPLVVTENESGVQLAINVTNTSSTTAIDPSAALSITLPAGVTATQISDPTNGWSCTLGTLKCTRTTSISSSVTDSVSLTLNVGAYPPRGIVNYTGLIQATVSSPTFSNEVTATDDVIFQRKAVISWATPAPILYGTALSGAQLDATSTVPGAFVYAPAAGTVLPVGQQTLAAVFTPTDQNAFAQATATVTLTVYPLTPAISVTPSPNPTFVSNTVTLTASIPSVTIAPTGTVVFFDGETQLGSSAVASGVATLNTTALTMGSHTISAVYSGDANYKTSTSLGTPETVEDFSIASGGSVVPVVAPGSPATFSLLLTPLGGATMPAALSLKANGMPPSTSIVFSPATVAAHSGTTPVTLIVTPPGLAGMTPAARPFGRGALPVALGLALLPFARRLRKARRWIQMLVLAIAGVALAAGVSGCSSFTFTPRNFSVTVVASSGNLSHTTTVKLTVK